MYGNPGKGYDEKLGFKSGRQAKNTGGNHFQTQEALEKDRNLPMLGGNNSPMPMGSDPASGKNKSGRNKLPK